MHGYQKAAREAMYRYIEKSGGPTVEQQHRERSRRAIAKSVYTGAYVVFVLALVVEVAAIDLAIAGCSALTPVQPAAGFVVFAAAVAVVTSRRFRDIRPQRRTR